MRLLAGELGEQLLAGAVHLATGRWITEHQNVLVTGATGTGKTFLACALAHQACRHGARALYRRASRLFDELTLARADGTYAGLVARVRRAGRQDHGAVARRPLRAAACRGAAGSTRQAGWRVSGLAG